MPDYHAQLEWRAKRARKAPRTSPGPNSEVRDAVGFGRRKGSPENKPWRTIPPGAPTPYVTEWAVYWYLTVHGVGPQERKLREGLDFFYQKGINAPGLFAGKPFTRGDFILPHYGKGFRGLVMDPISFLSHPTPWFDFRKRDILAKGGWQVIYLQDTSLLRWPGDVIEPALRGIDLSARGMNLW